MKVMKGLSVVALLFALLMAVTSSSVAAAGCVSDPTSGPPGTVFKIWCSGFAPNQFVNTYLVEPDGRTMSGGESLPDGIGTFDLQFEDQSDTFKANESGNVYFLFGTNHEDENQATAMIGKWTVVATVPGGAWAQVDIQLTNVAFNANGGVLAYATPNGRFFAFAGTGFKPNEVVNVWLTLPSNCSGTSGSAARDYPDDDRTAVGAVNPYYYNSSLGWDWPADYSNNFGFEADNNATKANESGTFTLVLNFRSYACTGWYTLSARAPGSGVSGLVSFEVKGLSVAQSGGATLLALVAPGASTLHPWVTLVGHGFPGGTRVNCWVTRPDGRVFEFGGDYNNPSVVVSADGSFTVSDWAEDVDAHSSDSYEMFSESAEPGQWLATCASPNRAYLATDWFVLNSLFTP